MRQMLVPLFLGLLLALPMTVSNESNIKTFEIPNGEAFAMALSSSDLQGLVSFELPAGATVNLTGNRISSYQNVFSGQLRVQGGDGAQAPTVLDLAWLFGSSVSGEKLHCSLALGWTEGLGWAGLD